MRQSASFLILFGVLALVGGMSAPVWAQGYGYDQPGAGSSATNLEVRLSALEAQIRALNGKVEQLEWGNRQTAQQLERLQSDVSLRLEALEHGGATQQSAVAAPSAPAAGGDVTIPSPSRNFAASQRSIPQPQTDEAEETADDVSPTGEPANPETAVKGQLGNLHMRNNQIAGAEKAPKSPPLPTTPPDYGLTADEQYERAFNLLRQANYDDAEKSFRDFLQKNPKHKMADNAKYWLGETYYARGKFTEAAVSFADVYQSAPKGTKAPDSLLKLAMSLGAMNNPKDACTTLGELKAKYPGASPTIRTRAEQESKKLKCR